MKRLKKDNVVLAGCFMIRVGIMASNEWLDLMQKQLVWRQWPKSTCLLDNTRKIILF